ncbi:hypothetical protein Q8A73_022274 [Channa argus]|nr:hypothetical protein Q8A73_022274 [Channa argus]
MTSVFEILHTALEVPVGGTGSGQGEGKQGQGTHKTGNRLSVNPPPPFSLCSSSLYPQHGGQDTERERDRETERERARGSRSPSLHTLHRCTWGCQFKLSSASLRPHTHLPVAASIPEQPLWPQQPVKKHSVEVMVSPQLTVTVSSLRL